MVTRRPSALLLVLLCLLASPGVAVELRGKVSFHARNQRIARDADPRTAVVYYEPSSEAAELHPGEFEITTKDKVFIPKVTAVPKGSTVRFPNEDPILHNVFSVSGANRFDLGLYQQGPGKATTFDSPGVVNVYCNVHKDMIAYVLVLETPHYAVPRANGEFVLSGLPEGSGTLTVWHERTDDWSKKIQLPATSAVSVDLEVTRRRIPTHLNKFGKPYRKTSEY